jgi:hypothetical protein
MVQAMTAIRLIPLPIHAALRMATGLLTMAAPFLFGFADAGTVVAVVLGALVTGVAMSGVVDERGHTAIPIATIHAFDYGTVLGTLGASVVLGLAGDATAGVVLAAIALTQLGGNLLTKYSASR